MDRVDRKTRSFVMSRVRSSGNRSTEVKTARLLRADRRLRGWRRHYPLYGRPDFAWPRLKVALFVDGCFWHGCPKCHRMPKANRAYWKKKVERNERRDREVGAHLRALGWTVTRVWECELKDGMPFEKLAASISRRAP